MLTGAGEERCCALWAYSQSFGGPSSPANCSRLDGWRFNKPTNLDRAWAVRKFALPRALVISEVEGRLARAFRCRTVCLTAVPYTALMRSAISLSATRRKGPFLAYVQPKPVGDAQAPVARGVAAVGGRVLAYSAIGQRKSRSRV
jgi:hypothetical protein